MFKSIDCSAAIPLLILISYFLVNCCNADQFNDTIKSGKIRADKNYYLRPGMTAAEILRLRGYIAKEFRFKTKDGYILTIVRGTNPLINEGKSGLEHKYPVIFIHGSISSAPVFLVNSKGARPQNWSHLNVEDMSLDELNKLIGHYDSARSMPMLAMNFGYEIWMLNRRGMAQSEHRAGHLDRPWHEVLAAIPRTFLGDGFTPTMGLLPTVRDKKIPPLDVQLTEMEKTSNLTQRRELILDFWHTILNNLKPWVDKAVVIDNLEERISHTFDPDYWNFSFDEQAQYDFPQAIEFVLKKTGHKKVHMLLNSAASPISLMSLTIYPQLAHKIGRIIHWGGAVNGGTKTDRYELLSRLTPFIQSYLGPIPFAFHTPLVQNLLQRICSTDLRQRTLCAWILDAFFGESKAQTPVSQFIIANIFQPTSSHELQHLFQMSREPKPRKFNFKTREENQKRYGQSIAPEYDFSKIKLKNMVFYTGGNDTVSSPEMMELTVSQLSVPYKLVIINGTGIYYNHASSFLHDETTRLTNLPSLLDFETFREGD